MMGMGLIGIVFMLFILGVSIVGGIWLVRALFPDSQTPVIRTGREALGPHEILDQRYARGEITRDQYQTMKQDLN